MIDKSIFLFLAVEAKALTSFGKHEPPNPGPAFKNLDPILCLYPLHKQLAEHQRQQLRINRQPH